MARDVWEILLRTVAGWLGDDAVPSDRDLDEDEADPSLVFQLLVVAPLLLGLAALSRRAL